MCLLVTPSFERVVKKLHPKQKSELDEAVRLIANYPERGEAKVVIYLVSETLQVPFFDLVVHAGLSYSR
ncbi:type II toxin-antitoxin system RelE/ParE family toxin [Nitrosomonas communis]|uniref:ParE-like toxin of type II toxin-antitoxin system n=1 Tax=Nitrosomonas communis TaxID=44574 RepID=A0A1H2TIX2_9PROT|nr:type II toxin-antitoxin system RelE/ParE family toxin [Nitrosomonas communis]SDW43204.1 ParE-like toxin of type II toxin-antitoxin system [Nitrosomonas communis]